MQDIITSLFQNLVTLEKAEDANEYAYQKKMEIIYEELTQFHFHFVKNFSDILSLFKLTPASYSLFLTEFANRVDLIYTIRKCYLNFKNNLKLDFNSLKSDELFSYMKSILNYFDITIWDQLDKYYNINTSHFENLNTVGEDEVSINYQLVYFLSSFLVSVKQSWSDISVAFAVYRKVK